MFNINFIKITIKTCYWDLYSNSFLALCNMKNDVEGKNSIEISIKKTYCKLSY